ncbi:MAG: hypothetical protein FVQ85_05105 [Planctomycetes bacterium]|nr:hypothetical protein [Planctomycetota bacterium]
MKTKQHKGILAVGVVVLVCLLAVFFSTSIQGKEKIYELRPQITLPEYRTDAARAIGAYERLMERYMGLTERNLAGIHTEVKDIAKKLISIDYKLTELSARMARIEKALGTGEPKQPVKKKPRHKSPDKKALKKHSPSQ